MRTLRKAEIAKGTAKQINPKLHQRCPFWRQLLFVLGQANLKIAHNAIPLGLRDLAQQRLYQQLVRPKAPIQLQHVRP